MRAFQIAFFCMLISISMYALDESGVFSYGIASEGVGDYGTIAEANAQVEKLNPSTDLTSLGAISNLGGFLINGFFNLITLIQDVLFFPSKLASWFMLGSEANFLVLMFDTVIGFIYVAGFIEFMSGREVGA